MESSSFHSFFIPFNLSSFLDPYFCSISILFVKITYIPIYFNYFCHFLSYWPFSFLLSLFSLFWIFDLNIQTTFFLHFFDFSLPPTIILSSSPKFEIPYIPLSFFIFSVVFIHLNLYFFLSLSLLQSIPDLLFVFPFLFLWSSFLHFFPSISLFSSLVLFCTESLYPLPPLFTFLSHWFCIFRGNWYLYFPRFLTLLGLILYLVSSLYSFR